MLTNKPTVFFMQPVVCNHFSKSTAPSLVDGKKAVHSNNYNLGVVMSVS